MKFLNNQLKSKRILFSIVRKPYFNYPCPRNLREIMKISLIEKENIDNIKSIWKEYHNSKPKCFAEVIDGPLMQKIIEDAKSNPFFIFPVKKEGKGYYNLVLQNQDKSFIYTYLDDYRNNPTNSTPYLVLTLFDELLFKKGVILVRGDVISNDLSQEESKFLFKMTVDFYTKESLFKKVKEFNHESRRFNYQEHINYCLSSYYI